MEFSMCEYSSLVPRLSPHLGTRLYMNMVWNTHLSDIQIGVHLPEEQGSAHLFLAQHYMNKRSYNEAEAHAHKCTEFVSVSVAS